jgi:hypothetical protein
MKNILGVLILMGIFNAKVTCQSFDPDPWDELARLKKELNDLKNTLKSHQDILKNEKDNKTKKDKINYDYIFTRLENSIKLHSYNKQAHQTIIDKQQSSDREVLHNNLYNPTNDAIGFNFSMLITQIAAKLIDDRKHGFSDRKKSQFKDILNKVVSSIDMIPIASRATSLISSVISVASIFKENPTLTRSGSKDILETDSVGLNSQFLKEFTEKLSPYFLMYENLAKNDDEYKIARSELLSGYSTSYKINELDSLMSQALLVPPNSTKDARISALKRLMNYDERNKHDFDYDNILNGPNIRQLMSLSIRIGLQTQELKNIESEFIGIIKKRIQGTVKILEEDVIKLGGDSIKIRTNVNSLKELTPAFLFPPELMLNINSCYYEVL